MEDWIEEKIYKNDVVKNTFLSQNLFGLRKEKFYKDIVLDNWYDASIRLMESVLLVGNDTPFFNDIIAWQNPFFIFLVKENILQHDIIDIGCGLGIPLWDAFRYKSENIYGIDMSNLDYFFSDKIQYNQCQILDLNQVYSFLSQIKYTGGFLSCTEMIEHIPYNPLPPLLLFCQHIKPDFIYFTAPTNSYPGNKFLLEWVHYKELPMWQGQYLGTRPHSKGWEMFELEELANDLNYNIIGSFCGYWRNGILAERNKYIS